MSKDIKEFLPYYLGCQIFTGTGYVILIAVQKEVIPCTNFMAIVLNGNQVYDCQWKEQYKPILRKLSSITDDEIKELIGWERISKMYLNASYEKHRNCIEIIYDVDAGDEGTYQHAHFINFREFEPTHFRYLLSRGFWLFGNDWFDEGLIIDKATLQQ